MDAQQIDALTDEQYDQLVTSNSYPPARDPEIWALLTNPDHIARTHSVLENAWMRTGNVLRTRKQEREAFHQECLTRGPEGKKEWFESGVEYDRWRRRASNFHQTVQRALGEVRKAQKHVNRTLNDRDRSQDLRENIRRLAIAVQRHQAAHARAGGIAEQQDYELWQLLDRLTVPYGPDQEQVSLRSMLDVCWTDVTPVGVGEERRREAEQVMRSAPAGQASRFTGVPKARHVHNDKRLA